MCRLVAYIGCSVLLENIIVKPTNSLLKQSMCARESAFPTNGDGFGLGWYDHKIAEEPGLFRSISPAWNDQNLLHLASKIKSNCFFAHVRAASAGGVTHYNCHPFIKGKWMLMHNGCIRDFTAVKRHLRHLLDDDIYNWIQGETDSEHFFALFLQLAKGKDIDQLDIAIDVLLEAFEVVNNLVKTYGTSSGACFFNLCLTDGKRIIATRYCTDKRYRPESMHVATGSHFSEEDGLFHMEHNNKKNECVLISSERLDDFTQEWLTVPDHHIVTVDETLTVRFIPL